MRWLFYALLTANGLLAFWLVLERQGAPTEVSAVRSRLPSIPLLSEVLPASPPPAVATAPEAAAVADVEAQAVAASPVAPGPELPPVDELPTKAAGDQAEALVAAEPSQAQGVAAAGPASTTPVSMPEPTPATAMQAPVPGPDAKPQPTAASSPPPTEASVADTPAVAAPETAPSCWQSASLVEGEGSARLELTLRSQGWVTRRIDEAAATGGGYIVYWPSFKDRASALAKMRELRPLGVDSFVIAEGEWRNGLSLGLFSRRENAERHAEELRRRSVQAAVGQRSRSDGRLHFEVRLPAGAALDAVGAEFVGQFSKIPCT